MNIDTDDIYEIGERYLQYGVPPTRQILTDRNAQNIADEITCRIAKHNAVSYCHPADSLLAVMRDIDENNAELTYQNKSIIDEKLPGFMLNAVCIMMPLIAYHMDCGYTYRAALEILYENGTIDIFAGAGKHLASENPEETLESLLTMNQS